MSCFPILFMPAEVSQTSSDRVSHDGPAPSPQMHGLTDEQLQERWKVLEEAKDQNISQWRAAVVAAWLEVKLAMPQYSKACQVHTRQLLVAKLIHLQATNENLPKVSSPVPFCGRVEENV